MRLCVWVRNSSFPQLWGKYPEGGWGPPLLWRHEASIEASMMDESLLRARARAPIER